MVTFRCSKNLVCYSTGRGAQAGEACQYDVQRARSRVSSFLASQNDANQSSSVEATQYSIQQDNTRAWRDHDNVSARLSCGLQSWIQLRREHKFRVETVDRVWKASNSVPLPKGHGENFDGDFRATLSTRTLRELAARKRLRMSSGGARKSVRSAYASA